MHHGKLIDDTMTVGAVGIPAGGALLAQVAPTAGSPTVVIVGSICAFLSLMVRLYYQDRQQQRTEKMALTNAENARLTQEVQELRKRNETVVGRPGDVAPAVIPAVVLLVEDSDQIANQLIRLIRAAGHRVIRTNNVGEAISRFDNEPPDVVLSDLNLPGGDGELIVSHVQASGLRCKVLVMSGSTDEARLARIRATGAFLFTKPIDDKAMLDAIRPITTGEFPTIKG